MISTTPQETPAKPSTLYLVLLTFAVPFLAALILLKTGWYNRIGTTNHGTLLTTSLTLQQLAATQSPAPSLTGDSTWKLLFFMPTQCDDTCKNSLYLLQQIVTLMGPDKARVESLVIDPRQRNALDQALRPALPGMQSPTESSGIFLVDTHGNIFMYYPGIADRQQAILHGRDIVKDLRHTLKLSKIG